MAFPQVVSVTGTPFPAAVVSHVVDLPATVEAGDLLLVVFSCRDPDLDGMGTTPPTGWTNLFEGVSNLNTFYGAYRQADGTEGGGTVTLDTMDAETGAAQVYRITGWGSVEAGGFAQSGSGSPDPGAFSPSWGAADTLWIAAGSAADDDETVTANPTNYTDLVETLGGAGTNNSSAVYTTRRELNVATEDPGAYTLSDTESWVAYTIAIEPAPSLYVSVDDDPASPTDSDWINNGVAL